MPLGLPPALSFLEVLAQRPLLLDAGIGRRLLELKSNQSPTRAFAPSEPSLCNLEQPEAVLQLHQADVQAGADALLTNTFGAHWQQLRQFGQERRFEAINRQAVSLARAAIGPEGFVLGSLGPRAHFSRTPGAPHRAESYREQAEVLLDEGVDALVLETLDRGIPAVYALRSLRTITDRPIFVCLFQWPIARPSRLSRLARMLVEQGANGLGCNCASGPFETLRQLQGLSRHVACPLLSKPNAGLPGADPFSPADFAAVVPDLLACGVRLLGGCCGTSWEHIAALRSALDEQQRFTAEDAEDAEKRQRNS